ncbi:MAG: PRC-barrel domain-containing protein [Beijerinckiaceae bacterium]|nr:PRC-barrel domain-containing protein [Beijerinckiaceae bacterium]
MRKFVSFAVVSASTTMLVTSAICAQVAPLSSIPSDSVTVTDWYKQDVYDANSSKLGQVKDVLVDKSGRASALILGVGGILGADEKDVAVPFEAVKADPNSGDGTKRLVLDATVDSLKSAPTYSYDRKSTTWVPKAR